VLHDWTVIIYMAGDTGLLFEGPISGERPFDPLERPMREGLERIGAAGSSDRVAVCVQLDSLVARQACRWHVPAAGGRGPPPQPIGEVNTGAPESLSDLVQWSAERWPAERYALFIWGHGSGWDETAIYDRYPAARRADPERGIWRGRLTGRGLFASTLARLMSIEDDAIRGLCYDDSARDFLDSAELERALTHAAQHLGRPKVDLLGLDACLMNMLEVAYQIRGHAAYMVGSEAVVPADHWPWEQVLGHLHSVPATTAREYADSIVQALAGAPTEVRGRDDLTASALDLARAQDLAALVDRWASLAADLCREDPRIERALYAAARRCLRFEVPGGGETDSVDLRDLVGSFVREWLGDDLAGSIAGISRCQSATPSTRTAPTSCHCERSEAISTSTRTTTGTGRPEVVKDGATAQGQLEQASRELLRCLEPGAAESIVLCNLARGPRYEGRAGGLSIYLPRLDDPWHPVRELSPQYGHLAFSDTAWPQLICALYGREDLPRGFLAVREQRRAGSGR
jgi:hypothetical protein